MTTTAPPPSLDERFQTYCHWGQDRNLDARELLAVANDVARRETDPEVQAAYQYIYAQLERQLATQVNLDGDHDLIKSAKALRGILPVLQRASLAAVDTETTGLDPLRSRVRLLQIGTVEGTYVIDLFDCDVTKVPELLSWLADARITKILHNAKFDAKMLLHHLGIALGGIFDTMLASQLLAQADPDQRHSLFEVTRRYLNLELDKSEQVSNWEGPLNPRQLTYAAKDVQVLLPLARCLQDALADAGLTEAARREAEAVIPLSRVELHGLAFDQPSWQTMMRSLDTRRRELESELQQALAASRPQMSWLETASATVNLGSEAELRQAVAELGFDLPTVSEAAIVALREHHSLMGRLAEIRWIDKVLVSFGEELWRYLHPTTGRLHPDFFHLRGEAGIFRSNQPNLHAVPPRQLYRRPFRAPSGRHYLTVSLPNLDLLAWAVLCEDQALLLALTSGPSPLAGLAAALGPQAGGLAAVQALAYALAYGRSQDALSRQLQLGPDGVADRLAQFTAVFPGVGRWSQRATEAVALGTCTTITGRRLRIPPGEPGVQLQSAQRLPLLGSMSDLTKCLLAALDGEDWPEVNLVAAAGGEVTLEGPEDLSDLTPLVYAAASQAFSPWLSSGPGNVALALGADWLPPAL